MPPGGKITANTGNAQIRKLGHTSGSQYGQNPRAKAKNRTAPRNESAK